MPWNQITLLFKFFFETGSTRHTPNASPKTEYSVQSSKFCSTASISPHPSSPIPYTPYQQTPVGPAYQICLTPPSHRFPSYGLTPSLSPFLFPPALLLPPTPPATSPPAAPRRPSTVRAQIRPAPCPRRASAAELRARRHNLHARGPTKDWSPDAAEGGSGSTPLVRAPGDDDLARRRGRSGWPRISSIPAHPWIERRRRPSNRRLLRHGEAWRGQIRRPRSSQTGDGARRDPAGAPPAPPPTTAAPPRRPRRRVTSLPSPRRRSSSGDLPPRWRPLPTSRAYCESVAPAARGGVGAVRSARPEQRWIWGILARCGTYASQYPGAGGKRQWRTGVNRGVRLPVASATSLEHLHFFSCKNFPVFAFG
jgi:hypothetical protein